MMDSAIFLGKFPSVAYVLIQDIMPTLKNNGFRHHRLNPDLT